MPKTASKSKKTAAEKAAPAAARQLKEPTYKSFQLNKRIKVRREKLPNAFRLMSASLKILRQNWKVFLGVVLIYGALNAVLVQGFNAGGNLNETKSAIGQAMDGNWAELGSSLAVFLHLLGSSGNTTNATAGAYQFVLIIVTSLALIWLLRQAYANNQFRIRDGFYEGMAPLVKFFLVIIVIFLQLIPMALGLGLYALTVGGEIATTFVEQILWALFAAAASIITFYMVSSSIFGLYIVTLPDMTPLRALRSARELSANRRWTILRKVFFLPIAVLVMAALIVVPVIFFAAPAAAWVFFALTMLFLPIVHSYLYALYRALL